MWPALRDDPNFKQRGSIRREVRRLGRKVGTVGWTGLGEGHRDAPRGAQCELLVPPQMMACLQECASLAPVLRVGCWGESRNGLHLVTGDLVPCMVGRLLHACVADWACLRLAWTDVIVGVVAAVARRAHTVRYIHVRVSNQPYY